MSNTITRGVRIVVTPEFVPGQSDPAAGQYLFAYHVRISNEGAVTARLLSRHWIITDGEGQTREVRGSGVVGRQPSLAPGEAFEYTSACPLTTPVGTMHGSFRMVTPQGDHFDARIDAFRLAVPGTVN